MHSCNSLAGLRGRRCALVELDLGHLENQICLEVICLEVESAKLTCSTLQSQKGAVYIAL